MTIHLSDYQKYIFHNIETKLVINVWYNIDSKRTDLEDFISAIKKRIDIYGDCEFNGSYTKFKKIRTWEEELEYWNNSDSQRIKKLKNAKSKTKINGKTNR